jgi:hypothetical protein
MRLSDKDVKTIKQRLKAGERAKDLAEEYGVSKGCISLIQSGKRRVITRSATCKKYHTSYKGVYMITRDETLELPAEWTDETCYQLVMHAIELGHYGNPAGFLLVSSLHQFIGYDIEENKYLKPSNEWDYEEMRKWIMQNSGRVLNVWRFQVQTF